MGPVYNATHVLVQDVDLMFDDKSISFWHQTATKLATLMQACTYMMINFSSAWEFASVQDCASLAVHHCISVLPVVMSARIYFSQSTAWSSSNSAQNIGTEGKTDPIRLAHAAR